jgi:hypothetical protein
MESRNYSFSTVFCSHALDQSIFSIDESTLVQDKQSMYCTDMCFGERHIFIGHEF